MTRIRGDVNPYPFPGYPPQLTRTVKNITLTTVPTLILAQRLNRVVFLIYNNSQVNIYVGDSDLTIANGIPIARGASYTNEGWNGAVYGIVAAGTGDVRVEEN